MHAATCRSSIDRVMVFPRLPSLTDLVGGASGREICTLHPVLLLRVDL